MRTTVTLEPDVELLLRQAMRRRQTSFKAVLNQAVRAGLTDHAGSSRTQFKQQTYSLGLPAIPLDKALALSGTLEDEEIIRKHALRK